MYNYTKVCTIVPATGALIATLLLPELLVAPAKRDIRIAFLRGGFKKARPVIVVNAKVQKSTPSQLSSTSIGRYILHLSE
jgi:hypothetical protein